MARRTVYHSSNAKTGWKVTQSGKPISEHATQKEAEAAAISKAKADHADGTNSQAVLHKSNGVIREERTYGADPEKTKG